MTFHVAVAGVDELADHQLLTDVQIDRRLYGHSSASASIRWPDTDGYADRTAALLAGKVLNCPVEITWKDNDLGEATPCFRGYIEAASAERLPSSSVLHLSCASYTKRTDLVPRFRAFQATTLGEIASHIASAEPLIKIVTPGDLQIPIALSLQHGETDFAYLTRMLRAWGVPMATNDRTGQVLLGARGQEPPVPFPDADWGWSHITFAGALHALPSLVNGGATAGATGLVRDALGGFLGQLSRRAADYFPQADGPALSLTHAETAAQTGTSGYEMHLAGAVLPFAPGHVVTIEDQQHHVAAVALTGSPLVTSANQIVHLHPGAKLQENHTAPPVWSPRSIWAFVTANEDDPLKQGRVQVEFEFEPLHSQPSHERAWLHTLTPYGGGQDPGFARLQATPREPRASSYGGGFLSLPEVGERVLVQFCVAWDDDAIIIGSVRHGPVLPAHNPRDTKRWRTPSGNEVALTTEGEGAEAKDVISLHARNHVVLEAQVSQGSEEVFLMCGSSYVHLINKSGQAHVEVTSAGSLLVHAAGHLQLEGDSVQILAKGGKTSVKDTVTGGIRSGFTGKKTPHKTLNGKTKPSKPGAKFDCAMNFIEGVEGGYTVDQGGATMYGVTHTQYAEFRHRYHPNDPAWPDLSGHDEDMKRLTRKQSREIFRVDYWDKQCQDLPLPLAICHFDTRVQTSEKNDHSIAYIAQGLGLPANAPWAQVKEAANKATPAEVSKAVDSYLQGRLEFYHWLGTHGKNAAANRGSMQGWANRIGMTNPYASSPEKAARSKQAHGDGLKQYIEKLDKNCPGCR